MPRPVLDERGRSELLAAVKAVEARTAAEVVVVVRDRSGPDLHASVLAGAASGYAALWFLLFSPWDYSLLAIQLVPAVVGVLAGFAVVPFAPVRRWLTPARIREERVRTAAGAAFHEDGLVETRGRTGVLVYVSRLERAAEVVADRGVREAVDAGAWGRAVEGVREAAARGGRGVTAVAAAVARLGDPLEAALPRTSGDVNELPDAVA